MLKKTFVSRDSKIWKKLYVFLVRPHFEYAVQAWCPYLVMNIEAIEKAQRRASKIPKELYGLDYEERIEAWGIPKLSDRMVRGTLFRCIRF